MASARQARKRWNWLLGVNWRPSPLALACCFLALISVLVFSELFFGDNVSAYDIVARSLRAERARLFVPGKVVHQSTTYLQNKGDLQKRLPDDRYSVERWWDNTANRRSVYLMHDSQGLLVEGRWTFPDGSSASFDRYAAEGPLLLRQVALSELIQEHGDYSPQLRAALQSAFSSNPRDLQLVEKQHMENGRSFLEAIGRGDVSGEVQETTFENKEGYLVRAEFSNPELGSYSWEGKILAEDMRVVSAEVRLLGVDRKVLEWRESGLETFDPFEVDSSIFEVPSLPDETEIRELSAEEILRQLEENYERYLKKRKRLNGR